jgi:hypothetical protein
MRYKYNRNSSSEPLRIIIVKATKRGTIKRKEADFVAAGKDFVIVSRNDKERVFSLMTGMECDNKKSRSFISFKSVQRIRKKVANE